MFLKVFDQLTFDFLGLFGVRVLKNIFDDIGIQDKFFQLTYFAHMRMLVNQFRRWMIKCSTLLSSVKLMC